MESVPESPFKRLCGQIESVAMDFERALEPRLSRSTVLVVVAAALLGFIGFAALTPSGFELGDAPLYAGHIKDATLEFTPKHIAYFALGIGFTRAVPLPLDHALNLMSALFAALSLGLAGVIAHMLTGRWSAALGAAICTAAPYVFVTNAVNAEVYVVQAFFFLLCTVFVLRAQPVLSGLALALAFLVTPSTLLAAPFLAILRPKGRFWLIAGGVALLTSAAVLAPVYREFLWGSHGLLILAPGNITLFQGLQKELREGAGFLAAWLPIAVGLWTVGSSRRHRLFVAGLAVLWFIQFAVGERYSDVPVQLPLYMMLGVVGGVGFARIIHGWPTRGSDRYVAVISVIAILLTAGLVPYRAVTAEASSVDEYRGTVLAMGEASRPGDVAVAPFATRVLAEHYLADAASPRWIPDEDLAGEEGQIAQAEAQQALVDAVAGKRRVWLPGDFDRSANAFFATQGYEIVRFKSIFVAQPVERP